STFEKIRIQIYPWRKPEGPLNRQVFRTVLEALMLHIMANPGISDKNIFAKYNPFFQPFCLIVLLEVESVTPQSTQVPAGSLTEGQQCTHQSDCATGLCCAHDGFLGKKRGVKRLFFDGFNQHDHGKCMSYRKTNETCMPFMTHDIFNHELFENFCPCEKGLECRGESVDEGPHSISHRNPKCQAPES
ncbi:hypothetical protein FSP39_000034, partial [Pinctada imbricata]